MSDVVANHIRSQALQHSYPVEQVALDSGVLYVGWVGIESDQLKMLQDGRLHDLIFTFGTTMELADWPDTIDRLTLHIYDPADARSARDRALRILVPRGLSRKHRSGKLEKGQVIQTVLSDTQLIDDSGDVIEEGIDVKLV